MIAIERNFCKNVLHIRKERGITQKEMAFILGVSVSTLRRIETEKPTVRISGQMLSRICIAFQLSAEVILYTVL